MNSLCHWPARGEWRRLLLEALILLAAGVVIGLSVHHRPLLAVLDGRHVPARPPQRAELLPVPVVLEELPALFAAGALPVDARIPELYRDGHLPGALNLPLDDLEARLEDLARQVPADRPLVLYCSGYGCSDSFDLALRLLAAGFSDVRVYDGGFPEWRDAGLPVSTEAP